MATREQGRIAAEIRRLEDSLADLKEKKNSLENLIFRKNQDIEDIKVTRAAADISTRVDRYSNEIRLFALQTVFKISNFIIVLPVC